MPQRDQQTEATQQDAQLERTAWLAPERVIEEPPRRGNAGQPLLLTDEGVIDVLLDGDSIRRV